MALATYHLKNPIEVTEADKNVKLYSEVNIMRRLKIKDLKGIQLNRLSNMELTTDQLLPLLTSICDLPTHVLEEMTLTDLQGFMDVAEPFFM